MRLLRCSAPFALLLVVAGGSALSNASYFPEFGHCWYLAAGPGFLNSEHFFTSTPKCPGAFVATMHAEPNVSYVEVTLQILNHTGPFVDFSKHMVDFEFGNCAITAESINAKTSHDQKWDPDSLSYLYELTVGRGQNFSIVLEAPIHAKFFKNGMLELKVGNMTTIKYPCNLFNSDNKTIVFTQHVIYGNASLYTQFENVGGFIETARLITTTLRFVESTTPFDSTTSSDPSNSKDNSFGLPAKKPMIIPTKKDSNVLLICLAILCGLLLLFIIFVICMCCLCRRRKKSKQTAKGPKTRLLEQGPKPVVKTHAHKSELLEEGTNMELKQEDANQVIETPIKSTSETRITMSQSAAFQNPSQVTDAKSINSIPSSQISQSIDAKSTKGSSSQKKQDKSTNEEVSVSMK